MTMMLHSGGYAATFEELALVPTPAPTKTWQPVAHTDVVRSVEGAMSELGYTRTSRSLGLARDGQQMFGVMRFALPSPYPGIALPETHANDIAIVCRNSTDKSISIALAGGAGVFVCDNLAVGGEIKRLRKHTPRVLDDLTAIAREVCEQATHSHRAINGDFADMVEVELTDKWAYRLLGEAIGTGAITSTALNVALREWDRPRHDEWAERKDAWRLYAGMTEGLKKTAPRYAMDHYAQTHDLVMQHVHVAMRAA